MEEKIMIVEDELIVAGDIRLTLERAGYKVSGVARSVHRALEIIDVERPDLVLLDIYLKGDQTGIDLAVELNKHNIPFVYLSANCNRQVLEAAKVTQPYGFIVKPFREKDLLVTLDIARYRYEHHRVLKVKPGIVSQSDDLRLPALPVQQAPVPEVKKEVVPPIPNFEGIIGSSIPMQRVFELIRQVAPLDTSVLVLGETGTGKEGVANCIHHLSPRKAKPFVKVNCAALPTHLIESELFGHEKGAFTGALEKRIGKFERADGGTIFLDEIGDMPADLQVKLLRVLQEKEIERIGGNGPIKVNVRIIAATNRNLEKEIAEGRFRLDLYYRLHVFPIMLSALRERRDDIPLLIAHFIRLYASATGKGVSDIAPAALRQLMDYAWPGNVRELQNLIERSVLLSRESIIREVILPVSVKKETTVVSTETDIKTIVELEREHILTVLKKCNHKISGPGGAAELLNLPPSTLASKMKKLGIVKRHTL
ncbi:sigma-54-dependent transcriptional regulator [Chitinophaga pinensis]|uniref:Two component, sigma54 specific, transcriptional regulator, Fis family n=1 Tax=Chitinophaga pinensis (strain ATCC 43595 / DSM 2588 / LMG 13176 / NBRC 15968 / NCIMB 11800 / UQM 2034) TaxID=485918 RepID=A0A979GMS8_CHIPD|nr:sigma-54 dependent transcriptional regulator [Chitinophaga pinensis]ACU57618.1 two component, sigma54 specific, transcriptional regulator, Fis family [Chitinophaga pinensis DSM 2588]